MTDYNIFHHAYWDARIALDLFLGGIGIGAFLIAIFTQLFFKSDKTRSVIKLAAITAPVCFGLGLLFLFSELGQPLKMYLTFISPNLSSPLSWGGAIQSLFLFVSLIYGWLWFKDKENGFATKIIALIGIPSALIISFYHGYLLYVVETRAIWHNPYVVVAAILAPLITGTALIWLLGSFSTKQVDLLELSPGLNKLLILFLGLQTLNFLILGFSQSLATVSLSILFWLGLIIIGLLFPLYFLLFRKTTLVPATVSLLILIGGFLTRYVVLISGQIY